jgi:putative DNA methylase
VSGYRKKLIEVSLPLEAINKASAREKSIRHGHPSTLHLWWARRPLAAARAVIFAQMVDDPSANPDLFKTEKAQEKERQRLFKIIEQLVQWENTTNEEVLEKARAEIWQSWRRTCASNVDHPRAKELFDRNKLPAFHDPFAGGGALPLEAQRLGLEAYASDLNPVAVLICKAMIEIPPRFAGRPPVNPKSRSEKTLAARQWKGAQGLAEDVCYYGQWIRDEAEKRIGYLYPKIEITAEMVKERPDLKKYAGQKLTVIAWLWARTVKSPNPAFAKVDVPLASTFMLSTKSGKEAYVQPVIENGGYRFTVKVGKPGVTVSAKNGTKLSRGANFQCLISGTPITGDYIKAEGMAGRMGVRLLAIVAGGERERIYLSPNSEQTRVAAGANPTWSPDQQIAYDSHSGATYCVLYGLTRFADLFTNRQLVALTTFSDLVQEARERVKRDLLESGQLNDGTPSAPGGTGTITYADAIAVFLAFALSKQADLGSNLCAWEPIAQCPRHLFGRHAIPMIWDFAEGNPLGSSSGAWVVFIDNITKAFANAFESVTQKTSGLAQQDDAGRQEISNGKIVSTDPPYYDNVPYADLSDFFYVWMRRSLKLAFPNLFTTLAVPKAEELVAFADRHGGKKGADAFFLAGMTRAMHRLAEQTHPGFPVTIYYAFKQSESAGGDGITKSGWDTFLAAVIEAGFTISGTWPIRTENDSRMVGQGTNSLASSIVLVCRKRADDSATATRRELVTALKAELPVALTRLQGSNIAPVDLAQAAIGPGMAVYTRYAKVLDAEGKTLTVRDALALINQTLDEVLAEQEGDFDADTRWAVAWFEQHGFSEGEFGVAETLSKAKNTSIGGMVEARILSSKRGKVRLLKPDELTSNWIPTSHPRLTAWEMVHQLIRALEAGGETAGASLVSKIGSKAEIARELAYRLYTIADRKKRAAEALSYNALVQSWPEISRLACAEAAPSELVQAALL